MEKIYRFIIENISTGGLKKETAISLLEMLKSIPVGKDDDIAVIGMAGLFPQAESLEAFWDNIKEGKNFSRQFPETRREDMEPYLLEKRISDHYFEVNQIEDGKVRYFNGSYLEEIDKFDYKFFKMTPNQANLMDPNQRLLLQTMYHALEDAGYGGRKTSGQKVGVYVGFASNPVISYGLMINELDSASTQLSLTGNITAILASRISYYLDLKGPSILVDTACSASLVAIHLACQALKKGECGMALVGGVRISLAPVDDVETRIGIESSDGRTKSFDDSSDGTGLGEGSGTVVLKPLKNAIRDRDHIYAVIKGSAVNQDGTSAGITAPNSDAQADVIAQAWRDSDINPESISYIEAHGTGTKLGDPIEIDGINKAFRQYTDKKQFCALGSVKANIGHLYEGSGVTSFIKTVLSLHHRQIPPLANFKKLNQKILLEDSPVYINRKLTPWKADGQPRRCGISAFGFGGTNCHVVLEEAENTEVRSGEEKSPRIITLSARSKEALRNLATSYLKLIDSGKTLRLGDIAFTAATGREHGTYRVALIVRDCEDLKNKILMLIDSDFSCPGQDGIYYGEHKVIAVNATPRTTFEISETTQQDLSERMNSRIKEWKSTGQIQPEFFAEACLSYIEGAEIDWEQWYEGETLYKVSLPLYPFEKLRCWLDIPESIKNKYIEDKRLTYTMVWDREDRISSKKADDHELCMVVVNEPVAGKAAVLLEKLREKQPEMICVNLGTCFEKVSPSQYKTDGGEENFIHILKQTDHTGRLKIIYMTTAFDQAQTGKESELISLERAQQRGVITLLNLTKAMVASRPDTEFDLVIAAYKANGVTLSQEDVIPENAMVFGLGKVIGREYPNIRVRLVDVADQMEESCIRDEILYGEVPYPVAFRQGVRYVQVFKGVDVTDKEEDKVGLKSSGVYLISGGLGGIGLEMAKYLADREKVNIALISRRKLPERNEWDTIIRTSSDKLATQLRCIMDLEAKGSTILCCSANISDYDEIKTVVSALRNKFGRINGILHCAGTPGENILINRTIEAFKNVMTPKVQGTVNLDLVTREDRPDFFLLFSSVASVFSAPGQGDYAAANYFMDSYAQKRNKMGSKVQSINWVSWKETGMAFDTGANTDTAFKSIPTQSAVYAFDRILNSSEVNVFVGEINYKDKKVAFLMDHSIKLAEDIREKIEKVLAAKDKKRDNRGNHTGDYSFVLKGREDHSYTETEKRIGQIWGKTFGYRELDVNDKFFDIGGDSIVAMKITNQMDNTFNIRFNVAAMFNNLSIAEIAQLIDEKYLDKKEKDVIPSIQPVEPREYYPLSSAQKRLYLLQQHEGIGTTYNLPVITPLKGRYQPEKVEKVLKELIKRHEVLRTSIDFIQGEPVQYIHPQVEFKLESLDLSDTKLYPELEKERIEKVFNRFVMPFDLGKAPLFRACLVKLSDDFHVFLLDMHHIISDGTSIDILFKELTELHDEKELAPLKLQYKDYSDWQSKLLKSKYIRKQEEYWLNKFSGEIPVLELPTDFRRPSKQSFEGDRYHFTIDADMTRALNKLANDTETTVYMLLMAMYTIMLSKYSEQNDIIVGTGISGRHHYEVENMLGMFVNSLAIRNTINPQHTFDEFLSEVRKNVLEAHENQDYQYEILIEKLGQQRDLSRNPLFDAVFTLQNMNKPAEENLLPDVQSLKIARFDLTLYATEVQDYISFLFEYCTQLFRRETIEDFSRSFVKIMGIIISNRNIVIKDIELLDKAEKNRLSRKFRKGTEFSSKLEDEDFGI